MVKEILFGVIGGLGIFLFGMRYLTEGLQKAVGDRMKNVLELLTKVPAVGILTGALVTAVVQSSSVTTVMAVGFVNAGLMALRQAIGIIIGANIGTTITAQLIAFKISHYALPAIGIGFAMMMFARPRIWKHWGQVIMAFGFIFLGLSIMKDVAVPLRKSEAVMELFASFSKQPILGVLAGTIITVAVQSSSATVGLVMALAAGGVVDFPGAIALVLGDNIGTCITAVLASIGTGISARRAALSHVMFNVIGVCYMLPLVYSNVYPRFIDILTHGSFEDAAMRHVANAHSLFNIFNAVIFLPMVVLLEKVVVKTIPGKEDISEMQPKYLERHLLNTPPIALIQAKKEMVRMGSLAREAVNEAMGGFVAQDLRLLSGISKKEDAIDNLQKEITQYLVELSQRDLAVEESEQLPVLIHSINDIERIGDHAENLVELTERKIEKRLPFSNDAIEELKKMHQAVDEMVIKVINALNENDQEEAKRALKQEDKLNRMQIEFRGNHIQRLNEGACSLISGIIFLDIINNLEKIGDHLTNIAQGILGSLQWMRVRE